MQPVGGPLAGANLIRLPDTRSSVRAANPTPTQRSSLTTEPRENLEAILRQLAFPVGVDVNEHRRLRTSPPPNESPEDG